MSKPRASRGTLRKQLADTELEHRITGETAEIRRNKARLLLDKAKTIDDRSFIGRELMVEAARGALNILIAYDVHSNDPAPIWEAQTVLAEALATLEEWSE